jgi:predicted transcriptional regulator
MSYILDKQKEAEVLSGLKSLNFDEKKAAVYLALLHLGQVGSSKIVNATGLHGQFVYLALAKLEEKGFVQHVIVGGRKKFSAKSPALLVRVAEEKRIQAEVLSSKLSEIMVLPPEQTFEVYQGQEAYVAHEFAMLRQTPENGELLVIGGAGDRFNECMGEKLREYSSLQIKKNISIRYIGSEDQRPTMSETHGRRKNFKVRYLPGLFTGQVNTNVWPGSLGFNLYGDPVTRFTVFSKTMAESYAQFFETLWKLARE